jgi:hypothetical protein
MAHGATTERASGLMATPGSRSRYCPELDMKLAPQLSQQVSS